MSEIKEENAITTRGTLVGKAAGERQYRPKAVAKQLGINVKTVHRLIERGATTKGRDGLYPVFRISRRVVCVPESAVRNFLARRLV